MIQASQAKARQRFWTSLFLFLLSQLSTIFEYSNKNFQGNLLGTLLIAFLNFALGFFSPVSQLNSMISHPEQASTMDYVSLTLSFLAALTLFLGARAYARGKGYPGVVGYLGLLGLIGVFFMLLMPDKKKAMV